MRGLPPSPRCLAARKVKRVAALVAALFLFVLLALPASASALIPGPTGAIPTPPAPSAPSTVPTTPSTPAAPTAAPTAAPPSADASSGILGTPDLFTQQDINCQHLLGATVEVRRNCASDGQPRSAYPSGNYGLDVNVNTGITKPVDDAADIFQTLESGFFSLVVAVVGVALSILGWAFKFDLFRDALPIISHALGISTNSFATALLPFAFLVLALVLAKFVLTDHHLRVLGHAALALGMVAIALVIARDPGGTLGWIDAAANNISSASVGLFQGTTAASGYANSEPALWKTAVETPWCVAEFGSQTWCQQGIDPVMDAARRDIVAHHLPQALGDQASKQEALQEVPAEKTRLADAQTNGELFLSFLTNADARNGKNDSWTFYNALNKERPDLLAVRQAGGWVERGKDLFFGSFVGIAFLLCIGYVVIQLVVASFILVACLLATPVALLMPMWEGGQRAFMGWLAWIGLSFVRKVAYGIYLGLVIELSVVMAQVAAGSGLILYWFLLFVLFATAFALRKKPMHLLGLSEYPILPTQTVKQEIRNRRFRRSVRRGVEDAEEHSHYHEGDQHTHYYDQGQHAHVHFDGDPRADPRADGGGGDYPEEVIEGSGRELEP